MAPQTALLTADEYAQLPDEGSCTELIRGKVVQLHQPFPRHGQICARIIRVVGDFAEQHQLGHVIGNDAGILISRNPDTVRGGDIWFIGYDQIPPGPLPQGFLEVIPGLVFEVKAPADRWSQILAKIVEYLDLGVKVVCVLDPEEEMIRLYFPDLPEVILAGEDMVVFPELLPGLEVPARVFFT